MPSQLKLKYIAALAAAAALLALPAAAQATLAFTETPCTRSFSSPTTTAPARISSAPGATRESRPTESRSPTCAKVPAMRRK